MISKKNSSISKEKFGLLCTLPGLVGVGLFILYPVLYNFYVSFLHYDNISPIQFSGFENYSWIFSSSNSDLLISLRVSFVYSVSVTAICLLLGSFLAHSLYEFKKGRGFLRTISMFPWGVPLVIASFMWQWMLNKSTGIVNYLLISLDLIEANLGWVSEPALAMISSVLVTSWYHTPFVFVLLMTGLESIEPQLYEAAKIDGANKFQQLMRISIPLNRHQIVISTAIVWMYTFRTPDVLFSLTAGGPGKSTYHAGIYLVDLIYRYYEFGKAGVMGIVLFAIISAVATPLLYWGIVKPAKH